jgi:hypothetical protein
VAIWNTIKDEFERAGRAANSAFDEGKLRLTMMRARQTADRAAQRLGYAVYRAKTRGEDLAIDLYNRHASELAAAEAEIARLETLIKEAAAHRAGAKPAADAPAATPNATSQATAEPPKEPDGAVEP